LILAVQTMQDRAMTTATIEDLNLPDELLAGADFDDIPDDADDSIWDWLYDPSPVPYGTTLH
jgi:hypothetical protein